MGKSTFLNAALSSKVSIVTSKPQTTRDNIRGIYTTDDLHIVFVDTPGIQKPKSALDRRMAKQTIQALNDCDCLLMVTEANRGQGVSERDIPVIEQIKNADTPVILAINKIDTVSKGLLLPQIEAYADLNFFSELIPISALRNEGVQEVIETLGRYLQEGPMYYPKDMITDSPDHFIIAEVIREKAIMHTHDEVPYSLGVKVEEIRKKGKGVVVIRALVVVERDSQKAIVIGRHGSMLKKIGMDARRELEWLMGKRIFLELFVKVVPNWTKTDKGLSRVLD